jgi:galactitol-specific phosphotransferase system IIB component
MAVSKTTEEFLKYAIKNLNKGRNSKISNLDKSFAPYLIGNYNTWGELYDAAIKEYYSEGGTKDGVETLKNPNYTPPVPGGPTGITPEAVGLDPLGTLVREQNLAVSTDENGNTTLRGKDGEVFLFVDTYKDAFGKTVRRVNASPDYDEAIVSYQTSDGGINSLFDSLYKKNLITKETYNSKNLSAPDFKKGLQYAIRQYGISALDARQYSKTYTVGTLGDYLSGNSIPNGTGSGTSTDIRRQETTRPDSDEEANRFAIENIGRNATKEEKDAYFAVLNAAEKKAVVKSTTTTGTSSRSGVDSGSFIDQTDKTLMLGKIFASSIEGSDLDTIVKSGAGAAQAINNIKTYAKRYGINYTDEQAMAQVVSNLKSGKDLSFTQAKIQKLSKIKYGNLADFIDDDTSVEDIAAEAIYKVSQLTGIPYKSLSVNNPVVAKAIANNGKPGVMTESEISYLVKTDPETKGLWLKTPAAKEEASGYANDILRMFGLRA